MTATYELGYILATGAALSIIMGILYRIGKHIIRKKLEKN